MAKKLPPDQLKIHPLLNRTFGFVRVTRLLPNFMCKVHCDACGQDKIKDKRNLYRLKSCGCLKGQAISISKTKHGAKPATGGTPEYTCWRNMQSRCYNEKREDYSLYGGRGIRVCLQWRKSFVRFLKDVGPKPDPTFSIERREVDGPYQKSNCYWADAHTQRMNQRRMKKAA
jgi:hypothetical protein